MIPPRLARCLSGCAAALLVAASAPAGADTRPIVDTHLHYSRDAWDRYPPAAILEILDRAGVARGFVSSTPDEGTVRLYQAAPARVVPVLRPYGERHDLGRWLRDVTVVPYLAERLRRGIYRGIGEFHLRGDEVESAVVRDVVDLAARHQVFLHCHCDAAAVDTLARIGPGVRVLWAHAGMSTGPDLVGRLLDRYPRLSVELALRSDVAPDGRLDPAWRGLFLRHPDRFMVGTDTWVASRWAEVGAVLDATRAWLRELPPEVAGRIAAENAERLAQGGP